jgi:hypothetical protein
LKLERFSRAIDEINGHFGDRAIFPASLAVQDKKWRPNRKHLPEKWDSFGKVPAGTPDSAICADERRLG